VEKDQTEKGREREREKGTNLTGDLVDFNTDKVHRLVKVHLPKLGLLDDSMVELPFELHVVKEHLVVRSSREEDLARVEFEEGASDGPDVERAVVGETED